MHILIITFPLDRLERRVGIMGEESEEECDPPSSLPPVKRVRLTQTDLLNLLLNEVTHALSWSLFPFTHFSLPTFSSLPFTHSLLPPNIFFPSLVIHSSQTHSDVTTLLFLFYCFLFLFFHDFLISLHQSQCFSAFFLI